MYFALLLIIMISMGGFVGLGGGVKYECVIIGSKISGRYIYNDIKKFIFPHCVHSDVLCL